MESSDLNPQKSMVLKEQSLPNSRDLEITEYSFLHQLLEIDKDIGYNENSLFLVHDADSCRENSPCAISDRERGALDEIQNLSHVPSLVTPLHQVSSTPLQDISNSTNIFGVANKSPQPIWRRLARLLVSSHLTTADSIGCKCPIDMVVDQYELPSKKTLVSSNDKENHPELAKIGFQSC